MILHDSHVNLVFHDFSLILLVHYYFVISVLVTIHLLTIVSILLLLILWLVVDVVIIMLLVFIINRFCTELRLSCIYVNCLKSLSDLLVLIRLSFI